MQLKRLGHCLAALVGMTAATTAVGEEMTVVSWGGAYTKSQILGFIRPYEEKTGVKINVIDYHGGLAEIRSQVRSFNVKWHVVDLEPADAIRGCQQGLLSPIDPSVLEPAPDGTSAAEDFIAGSLQECAVGSVIWSTVFAYRPSAFPHQAPTTLEDFFNVDDYPGARGMRRTPKGNLEWALMADGVPRDEVYEVLSTDDGVNRAFRVLEQLKPHIEWWQSGEEAVRLLENKEVTMTTAYNGRIYEAVTERAEDFEIIWDHQIWSFDLWGIPRHSQKREQALDFIRFATSSQSLARQTDYIAYGPVRQSSLERVDADVRPHLPTAPDNFTNAIRINASWWSEHFNALKQRFERWARQPVQVPKALPR